MDIFDDFSQKIYKVHNVDKERIDISDDINHNNREIMKIGAMMMMIIFGIMFVLSFILPNYRDNRFFYGFEFVETFLVFIASVYILKTKPKFVLPTVYFFVALLYYYGIYVGSISQHTNLAVTACLFIAILPQLFIDKAGRMIGFSVFATVVNVGFIIALKDRSVLTVDLTDVLFSWVMGIALAIQINRIKINSFVREKEIAIERDTDGLTDLWNKNALVRKITEEISSDGANGFFFILDLDHFKEINDTFGHSFGDEILVEVSKCIRKAFSGDDILGRFGGDEFIMYMKDADEEKAVATAEKLLYYMYDFVKIPKWEDGMHGSIGIAAYSFANDMNYDKLMIRADRALYITKEHGRSGYTVFSESNMSRKTIAYK